MKKLFAIVCLSVSINLMAQDVMFQGFYWNYPKQSGILRWAQVLDSKVDELSDAGITYLWLPPLSRAGSDQASVGYDIKDYYDLGEYGGGATRFGTRNDVNNIINHCHTKGIGVVADIVLNHRGGGALEPNPAVEGWMENFNNTKYLAGDQPYPTDRVVYSLRLGDTTVNQSGTYYFKIASASKNANFFGKPYVIRMWTRKTPMGPEADTTLNFYEFEPNGGGDCSEANNTYTVGTRKFCNVDAGGCGVDEFAVTLDTSVFNIAGDTLWISLANTGGNLGDMSDHFIYAIWNGAAAQDVQSRLVYNTYTNFKNLPSGKGKMDWQNFLPNGSPTQLNGDLDAMFFFYDVDHDVPSSQSVIKDYTAWMVDTVGVEGIRVDAVKHFPTWFMGDLLDHLHSKGINPPMVVGESYDFNPAVLNGWVNDVKNYMDPSTKDSIQLRVFDFALRGSLKAACDQFGYDVRNVFGSGCAANGGSGFSTVTFVNNHDFRDPGQPVINDFELAYAYIITNNQLGVPCVYYLDYFTNAKGKINALLKAHKRYIFGASSVDYLTNFSSPFASYYQSGFANTTLCYQLHGAQSGKEVVVAINFAGDTLDLYQKINMANLAVGDTFTSIFGVGGVLQEVNNNQELHIVVPPRSFAVYVEGNLSDSLISLDIPSSLINMTDEATGIKVYPNPFLNDVTLEIKEPAASNVLVQIINTSGQMVFEKEFSPQQRISVNTEINQSGLYLMRVLNGANESYFELIRQ